MMESGEKTPIKIDSNANTLWGDPGI